MKSVTTSCITDGIRLTKGDKDGYNRVTIKGRKYRAHRYIYEQCFGPIPKGKHVLHKCDNPPCFAPDHLYVGSGADNVEDMDRRGRRVINVDPFRAFTDDEVYALRLRRKHSGETVKQIAEEYDMRVDSMRRILNGRRYPNVPMP